MEQKDFTDEDLADLVQRVEDAAVAYINGDIGAYLTRIRHADDYTVMQPFGGEVTHGFDASPERLDATARFFQGGEAKLEVAQIYTSGDLAVLVAIERQHGKVGGLPDQDWSLRVTLVFRREGSEWRMAHRHADALVHDLGFEQVAALARG
jgi:ketosteroid isomerase-like protein